MTQRTFEQEARVIVSRNLTPNVAAVTAGYDAASGHLELTYFLTGPATDDDEDERELTVGELIAAFPAIRTASSNFGAVADMSGAEDRVVFARS